MIYSSSAILAQRQYGDPLYFVKRQAAWAVIGLAALAVASRLDYRVYRRICPILLLVLLTLLIGVLLLGREINGARRWFGMGPILFQPSEPAKLIVMMYVAHYLVKKKDLMTDLGRGFLPPLLVIGLFMGLILLEPDLGGAMVIGLAAGLLLLTGGASLRHMGLVGLLLTPAMYMLVMRIDYRRERLLSFLDPWRDPTGSGFQMVQSFLALGSGGPLGEGLGAGRQKLFYLPYPHTDFIFAVIGEELGLIGTMSILVLFGLLLWRGMTIAKRCADPFGAFLALGITALIGIQAVFNMAVVTGMLPTKGLPLPFVSYGGSSLVVGLAGVGILLSIARRGGSPRVTLSHVR
jgi:cell division protein FtsW